MNIDNTKEYNAAQIRRILQKLFPTRKLVLSQFTFFNQTGVIAPTGNDFRRGRRCCRLSDILPVAAVLALKEEGIPLKNISCVPSLIQKNSEKIFALGAGTRLSGIGTIISLNLKGENSKNAALDHFLSRSNETGSDQELIYWSIDLGILSSQLANAAENKDAALEELETTHLRTQTLLAAA